MTPLDWLVDASARAPLTDDEIRAHVAPSLLGVVAESDLNAYLAEVGPLVVLGDGAGSERVPVRGPAGAYLLTVHADPAGLVDYVRLTPDEPAPTSWAEIDSRLRLLGARVSFAAAEIETDGCRIVHGLDADTLRPIGSAFKLYVLGALAQAVAEGRAAWDEPLAIRDDWKSLPSGTMQNDPVGAAFPLSDYADRMISISDNTATDHLIHRLGRSEVERQLRSFDHQRPELNVPFLTTRAFFRLKATSSRLEDGVAELERLPLPEIHETWSLPVDIDEAEWFASPADVCRAFAGLLRLDQREVDEALTLNDGGLDLDPVTFPSVWFKGGSETGVMTLNYLARTADARALAVSLMVSDPDAALDTPTLAAAGQSVIRGAFRLLS